MAAIRAKECGADVLLADKSVFGASGCAALASGAYITYMPGDDLAFHLAGRGVLVNQTQAIKAIYATYDVLKILDGWGVRFVKELQGGPTHIQDDGATLIAGPELRRFKSQTIAIESHQAFIIAGGERNAQFQYWMTFSDHA